MLLDVVAVREVQHLAQVGMMDMGHGHPHIAAAITHIVAVQRMYEDITERTVLTFVPIIEAHGGDNMQEKRSSVLYQQCVHLGICWTTLLLLDAFRLAITIYRDDQLREG